MTKQNVLLILWIIYGFIFISAVDAILYFIIHLIYFSFVLMGMSFTLMMVWVPIITFVLYVLTTMYLLYNISTKSNNQGIYLTKFPKKWAIGLGIISFALSPLTNKLSGFFSEKYISNLEMDMTDFYSFYGWFYIGFGVSQILIVISLFIFFIIKLKSTNFS
ncbi:hypothetical protein [Mariniflexile sp. HMF6888]|uniref:hypothetical protein n=1 Tax=Mariniflexile sp. HMF6888 TaxID=3373086 RepID=UPI0037964E0E